MNRSCFMTRCEEVCRNIEMPMPREAVAQQAVVFVHKIHYHKSPQQLFHMMRYPVRSRLSTYPRPANLPRTERGKQSLMYSGLALLDRIPDKMFSLSASGVE